MSCRATSREAFLNITPVKPPNVNRNTKPFAHNRDSDLDGPIPYIDANHLNTFTPVGTAIAIVALVK